MPRTSGSYSAQPSTSTPRHGVSRPLRTVPACERCRQFKKKCSRTLPTCASCVRTGHECSLSSPAESTSAEINSLRARVEWLSHYVDKHVAVENGIDTVNTIETGTDLDTIFRRARPFGVTAIGSSNVEGPSPSESATAEPHHNHGCTRFHEQNHSVDYHNLTSTNGNCLLSGEQNVGFHHAIAPPPEDPASVPRPTPRAMANTFVDAFFRNVNKAYPFVDRHKILHDLEIFCSSSAREFEHCSTLLRLVMAIGSTTLQRAEQISTRLIPHFDVEYLRIITSCLDKPSTDSVRILMLLALYSLFDPLALPVWSIVGLATKQAIALGITRQSQNSDEDPEQRHRLYWSLFTLDRMISFSMGFPVSLLDENTNIPLPSFTIEEFTSADRNQFASNLQTNRHVIHLRRIEDRILQQIHQRKASEITLLSHADRRVLLQDIRSEIETWYSSGSMISSHTGDDLGIHISISWLCARYYQLMLMLHYPCHFNAFESGVSRSEVLSFAQKHLQSTYTMAQITSYL